MSPLWRPEIGATTVSLYLAIGRIFLTTKSTEGQHAKDSFGNIGCLHFGIVFDGKHGSDGRKGAYVRGMSETCN
jgi:hypothetical protein